MPIVAIPLDDLNHYLEANLSKDELEGYLEQLGCDIEDFTKIRRIVCKQCHSLQELTLQQELPSKCVECDTEGESSKMWETRGEIDVVRMDLLPVRPDIFDPGGLSRAIRGLQDREIGLVDYKLLEPQFHVEVDASVKDSSSHRPFIVCAVVRGLELDEVSLRLMMKLQENLHWALGRDRKLASIGIYDLSTVKSPIHYKTVAPTELTFVPLQSKDGAEQTPQQILESHPKGQAYAGLLSELSRYPLLMDSQQQVLSMPPIINSHQTRMTVDTKDVFIDVTGIVERTVDKTMHNLITSILELFPKAKGEYVLIEDAGEKRKTPTMETEVFSVDIDAASRLLGIPLDEQRALQLLKQMRHAVKISETKENFLEVTVPAYRNDIMHEVDLFEDLAIAYNYLNIIPSLVPTMTVAKERPERILANRARTSMTGLGFFEVMSLLLSNPDEQYSLMNVEDPEDSVVVAKAASVEQTMLRTKIMPQMLRLFALNRGQGLPQKLFEVDDIVRLIPDREHPIEELHLAAGILDSEVGFAEVKSLADSLARELGITLTYQTSQHPAMIPGRAAELLYNGDVVGLMGEVHPSVLEKLRLTHPLVALELNLQPILS